MPRPAPPAICKRPGASSGKSTPRKDAAASAEPSHVVILRLAARLRKRGYEVELNVGQSGFRCDLAVRKPAERRHRLGIMVDTDSHYANANLLERDVLRPRLLRGFGWNVVMILTKDWFENADGVMKAIEERLSEPERERGK